MSMSFFSKLLQGLGITLVVGKIKHELDKLEGFVGFISRAALGALVFFSIWGTVFLIGYKFVPAEHDQFRTFLFWIVTIVSFLFSVLMFVVLYVSVWKVVGNVGGAIHSGAGILGKGAKKSSEAVAGAAKKGAAATSKTVSEGAQKIGDATKKGVEVTGKAIENTGRAISGSADKVAEMTKKGVDSTSKWAKETAPKVEDAIHKGIQVSKDTTSKVSEKLKSQLKKKDTKADDGDAEMRREGKREDS